MATKHRSLDILTHIVCLMTLWLGANTYAQVCMVAFETTTFELMNDNIDQECIPFEQVKRNVCEFIWTGKYRVARKVERGMQERLSYGEVVDDERQSLLGGNIESFFTM